MSDPTRRSVLTGMALGATAAPVLALANPAAAQVAVATGDAFRGDHQPKPLPFQPNKLTGLSEKLVRSHWENNYQGAVKALNMIEGRLAAAMADKDYPPAAYSGLKREELHRTGSVVLHDHYFGQLGGDGKPGGEVAQALAAAFGDIGAWEAEFRRTGMALAGGSGWCVLSYNRHTRSLHNYWAWDHMHGAVTGAPLLVLDMYEHAFHMDYGAAAAKYVDAFMLNVDWEVVDARYRAAIS